MVSTGHRSGCVVTDDLRAVTGHVEAALEHIQSAMDIERGMSLPHGALAKVLHQAKRTTSRVLDELDILARYPRSEDSEQL